METTDTQKNVLKFLTESSQLTMVISSCADDGIPQAATVYYYVDNDFNFYFLTASNSNKHKNLLANPKSAITVGFGPGHTTVQSQGDAIPLGKSSEEENEAIAQIKLRLQKSANETWPIFQLAENEREAIVVFKFKPKTLQLINLQTDINLPVTTQEAVNII